MKLSPSSFGPINRFVLSQSLGLRRGGLADLVVGFFDSFDLFDSFVSFISVIVAEKRMKVTADTVTVGRPQVRTVHTVVRRIQRSVIAAEP